MDGSQLREQISRERRPDQQFIKWWRREHDFMNFELIDQFTRKLDAEDIKWLEGYELLNMDALWTELEKRAPGSALRQKRRGQEVIVRNPGRPEENVFPLTPEVLMNIFDEETGGDVID